MPLYCYHTFRRYIIYFILPKISTKKYSFDNKQIKFINFLKYYILCLVIYIHRGTVVLRKTLNIISSKYNEMCHAVLLLRLVMYSFEERIEVSRGLEKMFE